jgi:hypothetical protein
MNSVYVTVVFVLAFAMYAVAFIVMNLDDIARRHRANEKQSREDET